MPINFDLGEYLTEVFVETGTFQGEGVLKAFHAGFPEIYSIELSEELYRTAEENIREEVARSARQTSTQLYRADTLEALPVICDKIQHKPATFWLDAHTHYFGDGRASYGSRPCPLIEELRIIRAAFNDSINLPIL